MDSRLGFRANIEQVHDHGSVVDFGTAFFLHMTKNFVVKFEERWHGRQATNFTTKIFILYQILLFRNEGPNPDPGF